MTTMRKRRAVLSRETMRRLTPDHLGGAEGAGRRTMTQDAVCATDETKVGKTCETSHPGQTCRCPVTTIPGFC